MNELPDLISRKIWKYKYNYLLNDINNYNHKLLTKYCKFNISFNLYPENYEPSGSVNLSRLSNVNLHIF